MDKLREPAYAAAAAAVITIVYIWGRSRINGDKDDAPNSSFIKPAFLNAVMVYFIVYLGSGAGTGGQMSTEPF